MALHKPLHIGMRPGTEPQAVPVFTSGSATGKKKKSCLRTHKLCLAPVKSAELQKG